MSRFRYHHLGAILASSRLHSMAGGALKGDDGPLLPVSNRLDSFWLKERDPILRNARTTTDLPKTADVVIVGSGLTGAMSAYHLQRAANAKGRKLKIVMLEADECCGSATARNGGHCKPLTFIGFNADSKKHGKQVANQLMSFEEAALGLYADVVEREGIDCDLHVTRAFDVCMTQDGAEAARKDYEARLAAFPDSIERGLVQEVSDPAKLEEITGIKGGYWGASYPAGHLYPYKLATGLIHIGLRTGMNLQTYTPATTLTRSASDPSRWTVHTDRGSIDTAQVVVATNAYTSSLLPEFSSKIIPVRGTACSITPAPSHSAGSLPGPLKYTYGIRFGTGEVDYMIPRQGRGQISGRGDQSLILGGAKGCFLSSPDEWYNNKYDNEEMPGARKYFEEYMAKYFVGWDGGEKGNVDHVWSGVLGYANDLLPYVGEHPEKPGVFIAAGFTGHGMPRIPGCTEALARLMTSESPEREQEFDNAVPLPYRITSERWTSDINLIKGAMGQKQSPWAAAEVRAKL